MNNDQKMLETVKTIRDSMNTVAANTSVLYTLLVEQIGTHTVVSTEFVLPEDWYVPNCPEATEWALSFSLKSGLRFPEYSAFIGNEPTDAECPVTGFDSGYRHSRTEITKAQFITHVWLPWMESRIPKVYDGLLRNVHDESKTRRVDLDVSNVERPKFDPTTADKTKMYFAVHERMGDGILEFDKTYLGWQFYCLEDIDSDLSNCTHIDHEPIQRRN